MVGWRCGILKDAVVSREAEGTGKRTRTRRVWKRRGERAVEK